MSTDNTSYEVVKEFDTEALIVFLERKKTLTLAQILRDQGIDGDSFLMLNKERLKECNIRLGSRTKLVNLINNLNNQKTRCYCWHEIPRPRSNITPGDSIFKEYEVNVFGKNCVGKEKGVNNFITLKIAKVIYTENPGTFVLISGDSDYYKKLGVLGLIKDDNKIRYIQPEPYYKFFIYVTGSNSSNYYNRIETLEITCHAIVEDNEVVDWFANLNLFSWIHREDEKIIMYLENKKELNITKEWIARECKEISILEKKESEPIITFSFSLIDYLILNVKFGLLFRYKEN
ncbi:hypothetical protein GLOIN_2v1498182 [Rhizophagus clarus]|uniref:SAM domain-containing protein n=1 Tax=Rhizophagus clarus TaxID=94130 RepID=A0A8H3KWB6_9GLOM|nr:hypothetical protein GLOIN_2v1498182 [Rhizophagus clarus]